MRAVTPSVRLAAGALISNVWLLEDRGKSFLIDTGYILERAALRLHLFQAGIRRAGDLHGVLLTHRHSDHAGNAHWLRETYDCPIICHTLDAEVLSGKTARTVTSRKRGSFSEEFFLKFEDTFPLTLEADETFEEGHWKWGFEVIHAPGHTEGSVMLYHKPSATLFSGDCILTGLPPFRGIEELRLAIPGYSQDVATCRAHVLNFLQAAPHVEALCAGHGPAVVDHADVKLAALLRRHLRRPRSYDHVTL